MTSLPLMHFTGNYLLRSSNPITVNLIGAGGNGSRMLSALSSLNIELIALGHPGFYVRVYDDDTITIANEGRQLYVRSEIGMNKAIALVNRFNRINGTGWKAIPKRYNEITTLPANITISCVDTVSARFAIADILKRSKREKQNSPSSHLYWMDLGNNRSTGQVILSTVHPITQPSSTRYSTVSELPYITDEFKNQLETAAKTEHNEPSCSLAEALEKQNLFINPLVACYAGKLLEDLFRKGMTDTRGIFTNNDNYRTEPLGLT